MKLIGLSEAETIESNAVIDYKTTKGVYGADTGGIDPGWKHGWLQKKDFRHYSATPS